MLLCCTVAMLCYVLSLPNFYDTLLCCNNYVLLLCNALLFCYAIRLNHYPQLHVNH